MKEIVVLSSAYRSTPIICLFFDIHIVILLKHHQKDRSTVHGWPITMTL